jgi:GH18 family chitinase
MLAFTNDTIPKISASLDFFNIMTYDLMNRRDSVTRHHTGIDLSLDAIDAYLARGVPAEKANLGFAFYVKWFRADPEGGCDENPVGCKAALMEDPVTGRDLGRAGQFAWCDRVPSELEVSFQKALDGCRYDSERGGNYYYDAQEHVFWSWDTPEAISRKIPLVVEQRGLGGVFAWGLGEDSAEFKHLRALTDGFRKHVEKRSSMLRDEL